MATTGVTGGSEPRGDAVSGQGEPMRPVAQPRRGRGRILLWTGLGLALVLVLLIALAPTIGSAMAPGIIEGSVNKGIKGRVEVATAGIGWFKGLQAGPIELFDPAGEQVARVEAASPVTLWRIVSGRWWSAREIDFGTAVVSGNADLKRYADGSTNLQRALEPTQPRDKPKDDGEDAESRAPSVRGRIDVRQIDVTVRDERDNFQGEAALRQLTGHIDLDADLRGLRDGVVKAAADLDGAAAAPGESAGDVSIALDADIRPRKPGRLDLASLDNAKVNLVVTGAPIGVVDAVAGMGGALVEGVGPRADLAVDVNGTPQAMAANIRMASAGLNADAALALRDGVLVAAADRPSTVSLRSTAFLSELPQTRQGVAGAGKQVRLDEAPSVQISIDRLRIPLAPANAGAGPDAAPTDPASIDFRGAAVGLSVRISGMSGQVLLPDAPGTPTVSPAPVTPPGTPQGTWRPFAVEPIELVVDIPDLAQPVNISTGTRATLDGQPAGDIRIALSAAGLLDDQGRLRALRSADAGFATQADARIQVQGMSTALAQPIVAGMMPDLPIVLAQDVGPALDLTLEAKADVAGVTGAQANAGAGAPIPPMDLTAQVRSTNIGADAQVRLDQGVLTTREGGVRLVVNAAAPLAQRILQRPSPAPAANQPAPEAASSIALAGPGRIELTLADASLPIEGASADSILKQGRAHAALTLSDLSATIQPAAPASSATGQPAPAPAPVNIQRHEIAFTLAPDAAPRIDINGALAHGGSPFTIRGGFDLQGLRSGLPKGSGPGLLAEVKPVGELHIAQIPRSLLAVIPGMESYAATALANDNLVASIVQAAVGQSADLILRAEPASAQDAPAAGAQRLGLVLSTAADGAHAEAWASLSDNAAELSSLEVYARPDPAWVNPVLARLSAPAPGEPAPQGASSTPMRLGAPVKVSVGVREPVRIPLVRNQDGGLTPDWSRAGEVRAVLATDGDLVLENVAALGSGDNNAAPAPSIALRGLGGEVRLPLAGVPAEARAQHRLSAKLAATALSAPAGQGQPAKVGELAVDASALMNGQAPDASLRLTGVDAVALERVLGQPDLLVGAVGETLEATLRIRPGAQAQGPEQDRITLEADINSPRLTGAKIALAKDNQAIWLTQPATITWKPSEAFVNKFLLGGQEAPATAPQPAAPARPRGQRQQNRPADAASPAAARDQALRIETAPPITLKIAKLSAAVPQSAADGRPAVGPMKPGVFELDLAASAPSLSVNVAHSQPGQPPTKMTIEGLTASVRSSAPASAPAQGRQPTATGAGVIDINVQMDRITGAGEQAAQKSAATIRIANLADASGVMHSDRAVIDADVNVPAFPTPLIDTLAGQENNLYSELLGPTVSLNAKARNISRAAPQQPGAAATRGTLTAQAQSQRASAAINGDVREGRFIQSGPVKVELRVIRPELVDALSGGLPLVDTLEKAPPDDPAIVTTEGLTVPIGEKDLTKLSGRITVDPGVARFTTSNFIGRLLKAVGGQQSGSVGRRIAPFVVNIERGVATYDRFALPVGEFTMETRGQVDLVQRRINVVTYVPVLALTDEVAGQLSTGLAGRLGVLDQNTMVPITVTGSLDNPQTKLDIELFIRESGERLIREPGRLIENIFKPKDQDRK